ncbi:MAG: arylsulfatase [Bryobacteraceae bacterium]|nr:arylsulfatase [Bryobacteraceae bacterium]
MTHYSRRGALKTALAGSLSAALSCARGPRSRPPNIVFIMADDLGYGDLGCYGQKRIRTPNIDRIAAEGMRFTDAYAGCTVCAPSRSVLMTGLHMGHTSVRSNPGGVPLLDDDVTLAELLKPAGYATGCFGKWGLGDVGTDGVPWKQGFDEFFGYLHQVHAHFYYPEFLYRNDRRFPLEGNVNGKRVTYSHDVIAGQALDFIRRRKDGPFFCYVPFTIPHVEFLVPEDSLAEYRGKFEEKPYRDPNNHYAPQDEPRAALAAMITRMDRDVGRIMALLKEQNVDNDTLVIFTSDNGAATPIWKEDYFGSTGGLRGHKQNLYEGGIRVPFIARWPGKVEAGAVSRHPCAFWDVLPTALELAGRDIPPNADGISIAPTLLGQGDQKRHEFMYWELPRYNGKTREFAAETPMQAVRMGEWKVVRPAPDGPLELYNLSDDVGETRDVASRNPAVMAKVEEYLKRARYDPRPQGQPAPGFI